MHGLVPAYRDDVDIRYFCEMLDALAFLPVDDVAEGMDWLRSHIPSCSVTCELTALVSYFDQT